MQAMEPHRCPPEPADEALAASWKAGDERAFELLYARYAGRVTSYAQRMLGRREDGEEICIETFTRIVEGRWRAVGSFRSWLFTVAHRCCIERLRRRTLKTRVLALFGARPPVEDGSPEMHLLHREQDRRLTEAIAALPPEHRAALLLHSAQELSAREVGAVLGLTDQQVRSQLSYARRLLRERLEDT